MSERFTGFPLGTRDFYKDLIKHNNREWFAKNKPFYKDRILPAAQVLVQDLGERLREIAPGIIADSRLNGAGSIFRIYRDIRFSPDKSPYKTFLGILWWQGSGKKFENSGFYFHLEHDRLTLYAGINSFSPNKLDLYRQYVLQEDHGQALKDIIANLEAQGYQIGGEQYKRVPRGYDKEHPHADLLLYKGLHAGLPGPIPDEFYAVDLVDICFDHFRNMAPLHHWLHQMLESNPPA